MMKKQDLKSGMLVAMSNHKIGLIINESILFSANQCELFSDFDDDLVHKTMDTFFIVKISKQLNGDDIRQYKRTLETIENNLLWQRPEQKEIVLIDGVEYEKDFVLNAIKDATFPDFEEPEPPKKKHVIEYEDGCYTLASTNFYGNSEGNDKLIIKAGRYRKTKENADYSLKRNKRENRLEALVEDLQGELGVGDYEQVNYMGDEYLQKMKFDTYETICEILNNEDYSLDGEDE
jgi:hypothetical protein